MDHSVQLQLKNNTSVYVKFDGHNKDMGQKESAGVGIVFEEKKNKF